MARPALVRDDQQQKQRTMRRLAATLGLIALAIVALALLDRYSAKSGRGAPATPTGEPPPLATLPEPKPMPPAGLPPAATAPAAQLPPPPPPNVGQDLAALTPSPPKVSSGPTTEQTKRATSPSPARPASGSVIAAPQAAVARLTPAAQPTEGFVVQLGMFTTVEHAQALYSRLREQGVPAFLETRVVVGPFRDRAEAQAAQHKLKEIGAAGVIVQKN